MTVSTPWLSGFRLLVAIALFALSGSSAFALQDGLKDSQEDDEEFPGLIEEGEYESPQFGTGITWTDAWEVGDASDPNVEHAIGGNYDGPVASDPDLGDIVFLVDTASETSVLSLGFSPSEEPIDIDTLLASMTLPEFMESNLFLSADAELLLLDATDDTVAILARDTAPNDDHVVYLSIVADPGRDDYSFWVGLDMYEPDEYENILTSMEEDIDVDGHNVFDVFSADDIIEALEAEPEPTEEPVETEEPTEEPVETEEPTEEPVETEAPVETEEPAETEEPVETEEPLQPLETEEPAETEEPTEEPVETEAATETATEDTIIPPFEQTETPVATEEATETATEAPTESATEQPAETEIATEMPEETATATAEPEAGTPVSDHPGLGGEGDYVSPQHDVPVTWTDAWVLDPDTERPVQSFPDTGVDALYLSNTGGAIVYITVENGTSPFDADAMLQAVSAPSYIESVLQLSPDSEIALSETGDDALAVMYVDSSGDTPFVSILEIHVIDDDTIAFVELRVEADAIDEALVDSVANDIDVNDAQAISIFTASQILDALP
jgi:ribonuclease E